MNKEYCMACICRYCEQFGENCGCEACDGRPVCNTSTCEEFEKIADTYIHDEDRWLFE